MSTKSMAYAGVGGVAWFSAGILGLVIHVMTIVIAVKVSGIFAAVVTLMLPVISQIFWFFKIGNAFGYGSNYCVAIMAYIVLWIGSMFFIAKADSSFE